MSKKVTHLSKAKIYNPSKVNALFASNVITCNKTSADGSIENFSEENAAAAREWVDDNQK